MATIICLLFIAFAHRVPCNAATPHALPLDLLSRILNEAATDDAAPGPPRTKYGAVPVYEFSDPEAASAVAAHVEREMPFVFRGAPSMASAGARWTPAYLKSLLGRGSQMHWFDGEYFRNSAMLYSVAPLSSTETEAFWEAWGANTTLAEQAARRARAQTLAGAPADVAAHHNSMYLQATAVSAPFIGEDLPLFQSPEKGHRESAALAALLGDLAVTAITIPECRFGLRGIRIEVRKP